MHLETATLKMQVVMKLSSIIDREEYKDYFDLACLAEVTDIHSWVSWWQEAYPQSDPISFIVALSATSKITPVPLQVNKNFHKIDVDAVLSKTVFEIQKFFD